MPPNLLAEAAAAAVVVIIIIITYLSVEFSFFPHILWLHLYYIPRDKCPMEFRWIFSLVSSWRFVLRSLFCFCFDLHIVASISIPSKRYIHFGIFSYNLFGLSSVQWAIIDKPLICER